jgi:hypothetical protein
VGKVMEQQEFDAVKVPLEMDKPWSSLLVLNIYRLFLIGCLFGLYFTDYKLISIGQSLPNVFESTIFSLCHICRTHIDTKPFSLFKI